MSYNYQIESAKRQVGGSPKYTCGLAEWFVLGPCVVSLEESPSSSHSRPAKLCISFVGVSDLLLITGYIIRCGQDSVKLTTKLS